MLKKKTSVNRTIHNLIGGEWLVAENNARGSILNLVPEFQANASYRGNFQAVQANGETLNVLNTAHCEEDDESAGNSSGELQLRWIKITRISGDEDKYIAQLREKSVTVPHLSDCPATSDGWLYLKMSRVETIPGDISFYDDVLGDVKLRFQLLFSENLPDDSQTSCILPLASVTVNDKNEIDEIIQQQFGPGVLWVPHNVTVNVDPIDPDPIDPDPIDPDPIDPDPIDPDPIDPDPIDPDPIDPDPIDPDPIDPDPIDPDPIDPDPIDPDPIDPDPIDPPEDSSSSTPDGKTIIDVIWQYDSVTRGDFTGLGMETHTYHLLLTGSFAISSSYPDAGYNVCMTGTIIKDYGDGSPITENVSWDLNVFRNQAAGRWDVFSPKLSDWAAYYQEQDSDFDTDFSTPVYLFPDLQTTPLYPVGSIQVDHHLIHGVSNPVPDSDLTSSLIITFNRR